MNEEQDNMRKVVIKAYRTSIPNMLPCGREINLNYQNDDCQGENIECCHTVCPNKTWEEIDNCYEGYK